MRRVDIRATTVGAGGGVANACSETELTHFGRRPGATLETFDDANLSHVVCFSSEVDSNGSVTDDRQTQARDVPDDILVLELLKIRGESQNIWASGALFLSP